MFRVNRALFRDPALFDLEMKHVFEGGWGVRRFGDAGRESGRLFHRLHRRVPILISRDAQGELHCFVNACPHKGVRIAQKVCGNARRHVCPYHSWSFDSAGTNKNIKWEKNGRYGAGFAEENHNLSKVAKFGDYRGFLFACLNPDAPSLEEYLGETRKLLDVVVDKSPEGWSSLCPAASPSPMRPTGRCSSKTARTNITSLRPIELHQHPRTTGERAGQGSGDGHARRRRFCKRSQRDHRRHDEFRPRPRAQLGA